VKIYKLKVSDLPDNWNSKPPQMVTQFIGDDFIHKADAAVLKVPSIIVPIENNYLINPKHPDASRIKVVSTNPFLFNDRFSKKR